jgi:membrane protease YdiL (CAAX protease family)
MAVLLNIWKRVVSHPLFLLIIGFFVTMLALALPQVAGQSLFPEQGRSDLTDLVISISVAASTILVYLGFTRFIERRPTQDFELNGAVKEWGLGAGLGLGAMAATIGVIALLGGYRITGHNGPEVITGLLSMAIVSGIPEEIIFRGIVFRLTERWLGSIAGLLFSAALFGILHLGNPNSSWLAAVAIGTEAGIMLGAIYILTRRLWAAIGLHMAWNVAQGGFFGVKVSGLDIDGLVTSEMSGPELLTGGTFGAEASLPAMVLCTALGLYISWLAYRKGRFVHPSWARFKTGDDNQPGNR